MKETWLPVGSGAITGLLRPPFEWGQLEGHFEAVLEDDQMYLVLVGFSSESTMVNHRFEQPTFKGSIC